MPSKFHLHAYFKEKCLRLFVVVYKNVGKHVVVMEMYQVSYQCVVPFASMRSEEVTLNKSA